MAQYRKKPVVIDATRWFKNGDHPLDYRNDVDGQERKRLNWEGDAVRRYRDPFVFGATPCRHCGNIMHVHGWIDTLEGGHIVCPGDWIIRGVQGEFYPCKDEIFKLTYEPVEAQHGDNA
jgi:hypothetical protein